MKKNLGKVGAVALASVFASVPCLTPVLAASETNDTSINLLGQEEASETNQIQNVLEDDTIQTSRKGTIHLKKYDITAASADGINAQHANGEQNANAESQFADYAIQGVEFTYGKVADFITYSQGGKIELMYDIPTDLAELLGLSGGVQVSDLKDLGAKDFKDSKGEELSAKAKTNPLYSSSQINKALQDALLNDNTSAKNKLEKYITSTLHTSKSAPTDEKGAIDISNVDLGLYLFVETKVPANVHSTTDPFFVSVPMTHEDGSGWFYDLYVYPKNQTDIPTLNKDVRQHDDEGKNHNENDYNHSSYEDVGTGSEGDVMDYIFVSHLPKITSEATHLKTYRFTDSLDKGLTYNDDVTIYWYDNKADADQNNTDKAIDTWKKDSGKFKVTYNAASKEATADEPAKNGHGPYSDAKKMIVEPTEEGYADINKHMDNQEETQKSSKYMVVSYSATINSDDTPILGDEGNTNDVVLDWRRTSMDYWDTLTDRARVYTFGLNLQKNFESPEGSNVDKFDATKVKFVLQNKTDGHYVTAKSETAGIYFVTDGTKGTDDNTGTQFSPDKSGKLVINGLEADTYILTEIQTSNGYSLLKQPIEFTINSTKDNIVGTETVHYDVKDEASNPHANIIDTRVNNASATVDGSDTNMSQFEGNNGVSLNGRVDMTVTNTPSFKLPMTGGTGTIICTLAGAGVALAGIIMFTKKNKKSEQ